MVRRLLAILIGVLYVSTASSQPIFVPREYDDMLRPSRPCYYTYSRPFLHYSDDMDEVLLGITKPSVEKANVSTVGSKDSRNPTSKREQVDEKTVVQEKLSDITVKDGADKLPLSTPEPARKNTDILLVVEDNSESLSNEEPVERLDSLNQLEEFLKGLDDISKNNDVSTMDKLMEELNKFNDFSVRIENK